jgi:GxxExxY protein
MDENGLSYVVIGAVIEVHKALGPGLPETVYEEALALEFNQRSIPYERQKRISVHYKGTLLESSFRLDFLVGGKLIVELKAVDAILPIHEAQLLAYLRLTQCKLGLLINFNVEKATDGVYRRALNL